MCVYTSYLHVVRSCSGLWQLISQKDIHCVQPQMFVVTISTGLEVVLGKVSINEIESLGV